MFSKEFIDEVGNEELSREAMFRLIVLMGKYFKEYDYKKIIEAMVDTEHPSGWGNELDYLTLKMQGLIEKVYRKGFTEGMNYISEATKIANG